MGTWTLTHPKQCGNCPWRRDADLASIPGYSPAKHAALVKTISSGFESMLGGGRAMSCHKSADGERRPCIGWLANQIGPGNNFGVRIWMMSCANAGELRTYGPQWDVGADYAARRGPVTLPREIICDNFAGGGASTGIEMDLIGASHGLSESSWRVYNRPSRRRKNTPLFSSACPTCGGSAQTESYFSTRPGGERYLVTVTRCATTVVRRRRSMDRTQSAVGCPIHKIEETLDMPPLSPELRRRVAGSGLPITKVGPLIGKSTAWYSKVRDYGTSQEAQDQLMAALDTLEAQAAVEQPAAEPEPEPEPTEAAQDCQGETQAACVTDLALQHLEDQLATHQLATLQSTCDQLTVALERLQGQVAELLARPEDYSGGANNIDLANTAIDKLDRGSLVDLVALLLQRVPPTRRELLLDMVSAQEAAAAARRAAIGEPRS